MNLYLEHFLAKSIGASHYTGIEKYADLHRECEAYLFYNLTGNEVTI
jgi:hypothetical protein